MATTPCRVSYCVGAHSTLVREANCKHDYDDATDAGEEEVDSPVAGDPQQKDVLYEVRLAEPLDTHLVQWGR